MSEYTYELPDSSRFFVTLKKLIDHRGSKKAIKLLAYCHSCELSTSGIFSRRRWNEFVGSVTFQIAIDNLPMVNQDLEEEILSFADSLIPENAGIGLYHINFQPAIDSENSVEDTIERVTEDIELDNKLIKQLLDPELINQGKELSKVYQVLFVVENALRKLIIAVLEKKFGSNFFNVIEISQDIRQTVKSRKNQEDKNKWMSIRGDSPIYYLDFIELKYIIKNNWGNFKNLFPSQAWIEVKIDELYKCRCLIAHNSNIGNHEIDIVTTNFISIFRQIAGKII